MYYVVSRCVLPEDSVSRRWGSNNAGNVPPPCERCPPPPRAYLNLDVTRIYYITNASPLTPYSTKSKTQSSTLLSLKGGKLSPLQRVVERGLAAQTLEHGHIGCLRTPPAPSPPRSSAPSVGRPAKQLRGRDGSKEGFLPRKLRRERVSGVAGVGGVRSLTREQKERRAPAEAEDQ